MMKRRLLYAVPVILAMLVSIALGITFAGPAGAITKCDTVVADEAGVFNSDRSLVEEAANRLASRGADVHVVTIDTVTPSPSLDSYIEELWRSCPSWKTGIDMRRDLILFINAVGDRKLQIYVGDRWLNELPASVRTEIQDDVMVPYLKREQYTEAFVSGIETVTQVIDDYQPSGGSVDEYQEYDNAYTPPPVRSEPFPWSTVGRVALWAISGAGLIALLFFFGRFVLRKLNERRMRRENLATAVSKRMQASDLLSELTGEDRERTRDSIVEKYGYTPEVASQLSEIADMFADRVEEAARLLKKADEKFPDLSPSSDIDLMGSASARTEYLQFAEAVDNAATKDGQLSALRDQIDAEIAAQATTITALNGRLGAYNAAVDELDRDGVRFDRGDASSCQNLLDRAGGTAASLETLRDVKAAQELLNQLEATHAQFRRLYEHAKASQADLHTKIAAATDLKPRATESFRRLSDGYVQSCWQQIAGNNDEASKLLEQVLRTVTDVDNLIASQEWDQSVEVSTDATDDITRSIALFEDVLRREADVQKAEKSAQKEIDDAQQDIRKAEQYIDQYDKDIAERHEDDLRDAGRVLDEAIQELAKSRPDYLEVVRLALEANHAADDIYKESVGEHEAAERLRRLLESEVGQAQAEINQARSYIMIHAGDAGFMAQSSLSEAETLLAQAEVRLGEADEDAVRNARHAKEKAQEAHSSARRSVQAAEAAEAARLAAIAAEAQRARDAAAAAQRASMSSPFSGGVGHGGSGNTSSY